MRVNYFKLKNDTLAPYKARQMKWDQRSFKIQKHTCDNTVALTK